MTFDDKEDQFILESSGRRIYAHGAVLGIGFGPGLSMEVSHGWDGGVDDTTFTAIEKLEISEHMIGLWRRWGLGA